MKRKTACSRLRHRLTLQQEIQMPDEAGGYTRGWQDVADLWAEIIPFSAGAGNVAGGANRERLVAGQLQAEVTYRVVLRYRAGVDAGMRLKFDNRYFNIRSVVNPLERNEMLELMVQEGVGT